MIAKVSVDEIESVPLLTFTTIPTNEAALAVKRLSDIVISAGALILLSPLMLVAAAVIKLTSPGSVFFVQKRSGLNGRIFDFYKFRSMYRDADQRKDELRARNEMDGPVFKIKSDPRITPAGRFIRKSSIDELPQLWNVFKGDMAIVGPRPPVPAEVEKYERWQRRRLSMKPGITCIWQVSGRNMIKFNDWIRLDLAYIDNWSLWLDLKILIKTVPAVLTGKGAY
jgi:exopolysaccharide biosynthesis polyprenyl glycosylphosphotransferase